MHHAMLDGRCDVRYARLFTPSPLGGEGGMRTPHHLARAICGAVTPQWVAWGVPWISRVAPCSALSRTLRAGSAGAASGLLDSACARRSAAWQVGTKEWSLWSNKGIHLMQPRSFVNAHDWGRRVPVARAVYKARRAGDRRRRAGLVHDCGHDFAIRCSGIG